METILRKRLTTIHAQIKTNITKIQQLPDTLSPDDISSAQILKAKLSSNVKTFREELLIYLKSINEAPVDEISEMSETQLTADEELAELTAKIDIFMSKKQESNISEKKFQSTVSKLPKLNLPVFDGDILNWHSFHDQFKSNIHNRNISDVDKLNYLKASVQGDAKKAIEGLETTDKNYMIALRTLQDRYGRTQYLIDAHYSALYKIETATDSVSDCRKVYDNLERHLRVLETLGEDINHNHLRFLLIEKFPPELIYEIKTKTDVESIQEIRRQLNIMITAREDAHLIVQRRRPDTTDSCTVETLHVQEANVKEPAHWKIRNKGDNNNKEDRFQRKRKFDIKEENEKDNRRFDIKKRKLGCIFCNGSHYNDECTAFKSVLERKAKLKNRCFICFQQGHSLRECQNKRKCYHCKMGHNRALCPMKFQSNKSENETTQAETTMTSMDSKKLTILQTAVVQANNPQERSRTLNCRVLLDSGSQRSYVTRRIAKELKLPVEEDTKLTIFTFGAKKPQEVNSPVVKLQLKTRTNEIIDIRVNCVEMISQGSIPSPVLCNLSEEHILADDGSLDDRIDLLLGNDYYFNVIAEQKKKLSKNLFLVNSSFGWILSGQIENNTMDQLSVITYTTNMEVVLARPDPPLDCGDITRLWELESIGITDSPKANREEEAIKNFNENTVLTGDRYTVSWPWREYPPDLLNNFGLAFGRLKSLVRRIDSETMTAYDHTLQEQIEKGIIEIVPDTNDESESGIIHYLPHHGVKQNGKPLRIVYDASSKIGDSKSLNQCLYCGPLLLEDLTGLLLKFRCYPIGITADVEKAFLQIALHEKDKDVTRFIWLKDINKPVDKENLLHLRFCRVPFGVISSPFLLNATIKHHLSKSKDKQIQDLAKSIYVDNLITGAKTSEEAINLYKDSKEVFQLISMNLREWSSNSEEFREVVSDANTEATVKVLGLDWHINEDTLQLRLKVTNNPVNTKRGVLKEIASVYDPCGFAVPFLLAAKLFLQELWKSKTKWDVLFSKELTNEWRIIKNEIDEINKLKVNRYYFKDSNEDSYELHCFTDASLKAYAAVIYIVSGKNKSFIIGKSRLVPLKDQDNLKIPRLELMAVLIGTRLINFVLKFLQGNIKKQYLWTDSQIVIEWIRTSKLLPPFVSRRVEEIKKNKDLEIRYVPSAFNPADVATRPTSSPDEKQCWLEGPQFIVKDPEFWPPNRTSSASCSFLSGEGLNTEVQKKDYSSIQKDIIQSKEPDTESVDTACHSRSINSRKNREIQEILKIQMEYFPHETEGQETHLSRNLGLFKDIDGILRCRGRMKNADWPFDKRYPILIPRECEFTNKIIMETHVDNYHVGVNHTLSSIRQCYWIPKGKSQVQKVLRKCSSCIKHGGGPFKLPPTPALPQERVNYSAPFTFVGVDYMGPLLINNGTENCKRWICLFTCLAVRAIHLEVVQDLTAEEGLLATRRFISCRGLPTLITSDNAQHFKLISEILSNEYCINKKIQWRFIPQLAPWFGGFYERLIGIVKNCMKKTLQKHLLRDSQLVTVVKEIEAIVNTRPLTSVDSELEHVLKPSDFLTVGKCISVDASQNDLSVQGTITKSDLVKSWKRALTILEEFKKMFSNRYLLSLRERYWHSHKEPRITSKIIPAVGQIVQIKEDNKNRIRWKVGKIVSLITGTDGFVRVAKVQVGNIVLTRSISQLYPLEIEEEQDHIERKRNHKQINSFDTASDLHKDEENESESSEARIVNDNTEENLTQDNYIDLSTEAVTTDREKSNEIDFIEASRGRTINEFGERVYISDREEDTSVHDEGGNKPRRAAAIKALEKIKTWTQSLAVILLPLAGSVATTLAKED